MPVQATYAKSSALSMITSGTRNWLRGNASQPAKIEVMSSPTIPAPRIQAKWTAARSLSDGAVVSMVCLLLSGRTAGTAIVREHSRID